ncbi:aspartyl protease family protein [Rossellomorea vietnamensis]|nr:aspartyl protease family protein [Rossellomorea vietnamensis]
MKKLKVFDLGNQKSDEGLGTALEFIIMGEDSIAINHLKQLYNSTQNSLVKSEAANLLFDLYFTRSEWSQIETDGLLEEPSIEKSNRIIARSCGMSEPPLYSFPESPIHTPMKLSFSGCPTIEVLINGKKKFFWLDTGAGMTVISSTLANECSMNLLKEKEMVVGNSTNQDLDTDLAFIHSIKIKDLLIRNQPALVLSDNLLEIPLPDKKGNMVIDGIIGWDIIQHLHLEIDYKAKEVLIQKPITKENKDRNLFFCGAPFIKVSSLNEKPLYFGLDTGANKTHFGQPLLSKLDNLVVENRLIHAGGIGDVKEREIQCINYLSIQFNSQQDITFANVRMMLSDFGSFFTPDGVFGSDIAKDGRLIIDYANRKVDVFR